MSSLNNSTSINSINLGEFKGFAAGMEIPEVPNARICRIIYRGESKPDFGNAYCYLPRHITAEVITSRIKELVPFIQDMLEKQEDIMIKELHRKGLLRVYPDGLNLDKILEELEKENESGRLNKAMIESWFTAEIQDKLILAFAEKLGIESIAEANESELAKLDTIATGYNKKFCELANPKAVLRKEDCISLLNVLNKLGLANEGLTSRIISKLEVMRDKKEVDLMDLG